MLFIITYISRHESEELEQRGLNVFKSWTPPVGFEFKSHYAFADGHGGVAVVEVDSPATLYEAITPFHVFNDFDVHPALDIEEAVPLGDKAMAWRDSVN